MGIIQWPYPHISTSPDYSFFCAFWTLKTGIQQLNLVFFCWKKMMLRWTPLFYIYIFFVFFEPTTLGLNHFLFWLDLTSADLVSKSLLSPSNQPLNYSLSCLVIINIINIIFFFLGNWILSYIFVEVERWSRGIYLKKNLLREENFTEMENIWRGEESQRGDQGTTGWMDGCQTTHLIQINLKDCLPTPYPLKVVGRFILPSPNASQPNEAIWFSYR